MSNTDPPNTTRTITCTGAVTLTYTGRPVEIWTNVSSAKQPNPNTDHSDNEDEDEDEDDDDDYDNASNISLYRCDNCLDYGPRTQECSVCGEDSSCYYLGPKMTEEEVRNAIEMWRRANDEQAYEEEESYNEDEEEESDNDYED